MRRSLLRRGLASAAIIVVVTALFLLSPAARVDEFPGVPINYVRLTGYAGFVLNWDSPDFLRLARHPTQLFVAGESRQSRPLYVLATSAVHAVAALALPGKPKHIALDPAYVACVVVNFMTLWASVVAFQWLCAGCAWPLGVWLGAVLLVVNDVVKVFFWTPHTQMFNALVPVTMMCLCRWAMTTAELRTTTLAVLGFCAGLLLLAYGSFGLAPFILLLALLFRRPFDWRDFLRVIPFGAAFVVPLLGWLALVNALTGEFYSHEFGKHRQFIWIVDFWRQGRLDDLAPFVVSLFARVTAQAMWFPLALAGLAYLASVRTGVTTADIPPGHRAVVRAAILTLVCLVPFFAFLGAYSSRLSWNFVPPTLVLAVVLASVSRERVAPTTQRRWDIAAVLLVLGWSVYEVVKRGPYVI